MTQAHERALHVDIIILDWNRPDDTIAAIQSARAQTGVRRKIWVVDQGSQIGNRAKLAAFCHGLPDVFMTFLERNVGVAAGRNLATRLGAAPYVVALDNDAVFSDTRCVERAAARLADDAKLGVLAFRILDAETGEEQAWDYPTAYLNANCESFPVTRFLGGGYAMRRTAFERAGGYDERLFFSGEERDLSFRMIERGYRLRWHRDLAVLHRSTTQSKLNWSDRRYFYSVRNTLYINHKYGAGASGFVRGAGGFLLSGLYNRVAVSALCGIGAALALNAQFSRRRDERAACQLSMQTRRYIDATELRERESVMSKLRRKLTPLPKV
jgi:GT2 family glycosyltransferase